MARTQLNVRAPADVVELIRRAAEAEGEELSRWIRETLLRRARKVIAHRDNAAVTRST